MINYMCLPPPGWRPEDRATCMISGWGLQRGEMDGIRREDRNNIANRIKYKERFLTHWLTEFTKCFILKF